MKRHLIKIGKRRYCVNTVIKSINKKDYPDILFALDLSIGGINTGWICIPLLNNHLDHLGYELIFNLQHGGWKTLGCDLKGNNIISFLKCCGYATDEEIAILVVNARRISERRRYINKSLTTN